MPSQKLLSQRSFLEVADLQTPTEWIRVRGLRTIRDLRSGAAAEIDVSDLDSTGKEYLLGLNDPGSMNVELFYDPNDPGQIVLETLRDLNTANTFRAGVPNPLQSGSPSGFTVFSFTGLVRTFPFTAAVDAAVEGAVEIRLSGTIGKS